MSVSLLLEESFKLRSLWNPERHRIRRVPLDPAKGTRNTRSMESLWEEFEPTAFLYAYMAFNTLYVIDWERTLNLGDVVEASVGYEIGRINRFIDFTLSNEEAAASFVQRVRRIAPAGNMSLIGELQRLEPFPQTKYVPAGLERRIVTATQAILSENPNADLVADTKEIFRGVYEVRCNIFHGRKAVLDLAQDHPQMIRIGIFREFTVALLDTFFLKVRQVRGWSPYFEGSLDELVQPAGAN